MSFRDAEASDAALKGITTILRTALGQPDYRRNPQQVYDSMDSDPLIGTLPEPGKPASRMELLRHVSNHRGSPSAIHDEVVAFCRQHLQEGPESSNRAAGVLGRVQRLLSLADAIADPDSGLSQRNAEALVRDLMDGGLEPAAKLARQKLDLAGKALSRYQMWCYPPADVQEPFREIGTRRSEAVNMLGLGHFAYDDPTAELVRWVHALPGRVRSRLPTAWDAGASPGNVHWRPGGRTYQLDLDDYGVPEVVHDPIRGDDLITPIEVLS